MKAEKEGTGPFVVNKKGTKSDRKLWASNMSKSSEDKFDKYMKIKSLGIAAKKELSRRGKG